MALTKYKLGNLLQFLDNRNVDLLYGSDDVRGVNNLKELMPTKADISGRDLRKFQIVNPGEFVFNHRTSRNGSKFSIAYNDTEKPVICTEDYVVFRVTEEAQRCILSARWLYIFFKRAEFDRYVITNSWGSSTEFFNWDDVCDIEIELPPLDIQQKYVDVYQAMLANQQSYEQGLEDLKLVCDAYIEELRRKVPCQKIGPFISLSEQKNDDEVYGLHSVRGISIEKKFISTKAKMEGVNLKPYYIVGPDEFAFVPVTSRNGGKISIALNQSKKPYICSSSYVVFKINDKTKIWPAYLQMYFERSEFNRYARFHSWGSARETFDFDEMCDVEIPIPNIKIQKAISDIYAVYIERKHINERLKERIKNICPILIKGSLDEGRA